MELVGFYTKFLDVAVEETRTIHVRQPGRLPVGEYGFTEYYCEDPDCDCRKVRLCVRSPSTESKIWASIDYGWENEAFYTAWMGAPLDAEMLAGLKGPRLAPGAPQGEHAEAFLQHFKTMLLPDEDYIERLKRHYWMMKEAYRATKPQLKRKVGRDARKARKAIRKKGRKKR